MARQIVVDGGPITDLVSTGPSGYVGGQTTPLVVRKMTGDFTNWTLYNLDLRGADLSAMTTRHLYSRACRLGLNTKLPPFFQGNNFDFLRAWFRQRQEDFRSNPTDYALIGGIFKDIAPGYFDETSIGRYTHYAWSRLNTAATGGGKDWRNLMRTAPERLREFFAPAPQLLKQMIRARRSHGPAVIAADPFPALDDFDPPAVRMGYYGLVVKYETPTGALKVRRLSPNQLPQPTYTQDRYDVERRVERLLRRLTGIAWTCHIAEMFPLLMGQVFPAADVPADWWKTYSEWGGSRD